MSYVNVIIVTYCLIMPMYTPNATPHTYTHTRAHVCLLTHAGAHFVMSPRGRRLLNLNSRMGKSPFNSTRWLVIAQDSFDITLTHSLTHSPTHLDCSSVASLTPC